MVLELLSHRTPSSCNVANTLKVAEILFPQTKIVKELPSIYFVRGHISALSFFTQLFVAYQLRKADKFLEHHYDCTQRSQFSLKNFIIRIATEGGFKKLIFSSAILSEDETSEMVTKCIIQTFKEGRSMHTAWREITKRKYSHWQEFLDMIPSPCQLPIAKISKGGCIMTDNFNAARKFRRLLIEAITEIANKQGMTSNKIIFLRQISCTT